MKAANCFAGLALITGMSLFAFSADEKPRGNGHGGGDRKGGKGGDKPIENLAYLFWKDAPAHPLDLVLGRPTKNSIAASVLS